MEAFHTLVRERRKRLGFSTAKEFHRKKTTELSISYESYANIEAGKYLPPADRLADLISALEIEDLKGFVFSFCSSLMPNDLLRNYFSEDEKSRKNQVLLNSDPSVDYREKFNALLQFNRMQTKFELTDEQVLFLEKDVVCWDIVNLFIGTGDEGYSVQFIAEKTGSDVESTNVRIEGLISRGMLKQLESGLYLVTQDAFIIPRRAVASKLTQLLVAREVDQSFKDSRNQPYARFRFMPMDPQDRDNIEAFIDNFILDSRKFKKPVQKGGKTHYIQVLFSDRNDLS